MSDPKNKWKRPAAPPAPMFFGKKERDLVKQVNDELAERVLGQTIAYYPISIEESNFNDIYGEAKEKVSLPPVRVFAYVIVDNEQTNNKYGYEYQTKLTVNFHRRRLVEDQNLFVRVGDFVQYGEVFYEIVKTYNDTRYLFGQVEHKFQISAECVKAREGVFRVIPAVDRPTPTAQQDTDITSPAPRAAPYPPLDATYITVNKETKLPNERVLTAGTGITLTDGGPNGNLTIDAAGANAQGTAGAVQLQGGDGVFVGDSDLVFLTGSNRLGVGTSSPSTTLHVSGTTGDPQTAVRLSGQGPKLQFDETDAGAGKFQIAAANGMLKWQVQNSDFNDANVKWMMNQNGEMAFRDGAAGEAIPARVFISGSGNSNLFQVSSSTAADILVVTGSGRVGIGTASPSHNLTIAGDLSASADALFGSDVYIAGTLHGGSPLKVSGSIDILHNGVKAVELGALSNNGEVMISASCIEGRDITVQQVTASWIYAPDLFTGTAATSGSYLAVDSNNQIILATASAGGGGNADAQGPTGSLQFQIGAGAISGSTPILYDFAQNQLTVNSGMVHSRAAVSASHTASVSNYILGVTHVPSSILFNAANFSAGQVLVVKDESGAASAVNVITLAANGSQTIDGNAAAYIESPYGSVLLYTDGANWFIY
jgi:hypothetical protein